MMRRIFLGLALSLGLIPAVLAQAPADPVAQVRAVYRSYQEGKPPAWYERDYSARLRKMIDDDRADAEKNGDTGKFDWDPIVNAQDWKLNALKVSVVSKSDDHAVVDAAFRNLGEAERIRFSLVSENGKWAIDDLESLIKPRWTMSKVYTGAPDAFPKE